MDPTCSKSDDPNKPFPEWVKENGGDDDFISILANSGFTSYLSLHFLDVGSEDGKRSNQMLFECYLQFHLVKQMSKPKSLWTDDLVQLLLGCKEQAWIS